MKKHESQVGDGGKLKLKAAVLYDCSKEVHTTQPARFAAKDQSQVLELSGAHFNELRLA